MNVPIVGPFMLSSPPLIKSSRKLPVTAFGRGEERIMIKPKKSFAALIAITLMLAVAYSAAARSRVAPGRNVAVASPQEPDTRKLEDAGLQFEVPKGWKVENNDGN